MSNKYLLVALFFFLVSNLVSAQKYTISGYIEDAATGEKMIGASIYDAKSQKGTTTNVYGFYSLTLPADTVNIVIRYIGYQTSFNKLFLQKDFVLNVALKPGNELKEVEIVEYKQEKIEDRSRMSTIEIPIQQIKKIPALLGEVDVLKVIQLLPGVQSGGEGSSGFYVRGGGPDQNLILLDGVPVYNASHLFGFFSVFNADAIKNVEIVKGGFPARYGGRLSSVLEINMKEGNNKEFHGEGSIGFISSKLTLEGPIIKDKTSFIISGRRTYIDYLLRPLIKKQANGDVGGYYFYDLNGKINHKLSEKDHIYLSAYTGNDKFYARTEEQDSNNGNTIVQKNDFGIGWGNTTTALRWNHVFNSKLFSNTTLTYSKYNFDTEIKFSSEDKKGIKENNQSFQLNYLSGINDVGGKIDFDYFPTPNHYIRFGVAETYHEFNTGAQQYKFKTGTAAEVNTKVGDNPLYAHEAFVYVEDDWKITDKIKINFGLHSSTFVVKDKVYPTIQPRFSGRYLLPHSWSVKASVATMTQFIHLLSNSSVGLPTDLWVPSTTTIKPEQSLQYAAGIAKSLLDNEYELSVEGYYKTMSNVLDYVDGANFMQSNSAWEKKVEQGEAWSYGGEFFVQRKKGKFTGWVGYTLSWTWRKFPTINFGKAFPYKYDRRHDFELVLNYEINDRIDISGTWVYGTGNAISLPLQTYLTNDYYELTAPISNYGGIDYYGEKNSFRMAAYHRLDLGVNIKKKKKYWERTWTFGVYNAYNRKNPYFIYFGFDDNGNKAAKQVSLFPILPSASYSFKF